MEVKLSFILYMIPVMFFLQSCNKDEQEDEDAALKENYKIYLDRQNRFTKIDYSTDSVNITKTYKYTDETVVVKDYFDYGGRNLTFIRTYYINSLGLADSCLVTDSAMKPFHTYHYNYTSEGYLESDGTYHFGYSGGNRVTVSYPKYDILQTQPPDDVYSYSAMPNLIDIDGFNGTYLGKINKNLASKRKLLKYEVNYSYTMNDKNYVLKRNEIWTETSTNNLPRKKIINFEYFFVK